MNDYNNIKVLPNYSILIMKNIMWYNDDDETEIFGVKMEKVKH